MAFGNVLKDLEMILKMFSLSMIFISESFGPVNYHMWRINFCMPKRIFCILRAYSHPAAASLGVNESLVVNGIKNRAFPIRKVTILMLLHLRYVHGCCFILISFLCIRHKK